MFETHEIRPTACNGEHKNMDGPPSKPTSGNPPFVGPLPPELLELLFNCTSDGVFAMDSEKRIIAFNHAAEVSLGVSREEALGRPCHEVIRSNICRDRCAMTRTLETGEPEVNLAVELTDSQGRPVPASLSSSVLHDQDGQVIGCVETFRNLNWVKDRLREAEGRQPFSDIVSDDPHMDHIFDILPTIAGSESTILVHGETGTGKTLIARAIHNFSPRRDHPFITINCGALPETLLESELFGYRAGAFTGASRDRAGRIAFAEGGTLFLDEIGDMSPGMQVKLLRFLQEHVYERLGDPAVIKADVRIVAATNRSLANLVEQGRFRRDLYYRVNVLNVEMPPLRERPRDIPLLAQRFLERLSRQGNKQLMGISRAALDVLMTYDFPGNIRELENIIEHAFVLCHGPLVEPRHLPDIFQKYKGVTRDPKARSFADVEARFILEALERNRWNRQETALDLGIHKTTLLRKIQRLGLELPRTDGRSHRKRK
jgi:PAS domain S-box-containing protein